MDEEADLLETHDIEELLKRDHESIQTLSNMLMSGNYSVMAEALAVLVSDIPEAPTNVRLLLSTATALIILGIWGVCVVSVGFSGIGFIADFFLCFIGLGILSLALNIGLQTFPLFKEDNSK